jgi:hypothetical protein
MVCKIYFLLFFYFLNNVSMFESQQKGISKNFFLSLCNRDLNSSCNKICTVDDEKGFQSYIMYTIIDTIDPLCKNIIFMAKPKQNYTLWNQIFPESKNFLEKIYQLRQKEIIFSRRNKKKLLDNANNKYMFFEKAKKYFYPQGEGNEGLDVFTINLYSNCAIASGKSNKDIIHELIEALFG